MFSKISQLGDSDFSYRCLDNDKTARTFAYGRQFHKLNRLVYIEKLSEHFLHYENCFDSNFVLISPCNVKIKYFTYERKHLCSIRFCRPVGWIKVLLLSTIRSKHEMKTIRSSEPWIDILKKLHLSLRPHT